MAILLAAVIIPAAKASAARIAIVLSAEAKPYRQVEAELKARLKKLDHTTETFMLADVNRDLARFAGKTDAFLAVGTKAADWLHRNLRPDKPLTYCMVSDPRAAGLTKGRQTLGVSTSVPVKAQFQTIADALPGTKSLGMLYRSRTTKGTALLKQAKGALPRGWRLEAVDVDKHASVAKAIEALLARDVDIVWTAPDASLYKTATVRSLLLAAVRQKTPIFGFSPAFVRAGALLGVGVSPVDQGEQAATLTDRLLTKQAGAGQAVPKFEIAVNLIVAEKLSVSLPETFVKRARYVFKRDRKKGSK
ncbi:MAG: ABC transporter substrate binding protein [Planctomycetota bacterium]|nr:ABC transporter substrate binding protein [Planctomycetota bacterium]